MIDFKFGYFINYLILSKSFIEFSYLKTYPRHMVDVVKKEKVFI